MSIFRRTICIALALIAVLPSFGQKAGQPKDSVFRLVRADEARQVTEDGIQYRRVKGNARFFHNNTTLLCDSASWNLDINIIDAYGNVRILQDGTTITSEVLTYYVDDNLATFRGGLVQLKDKDGNILRTRNLDYNTKDSLATFMEGGAMKSKDGNAIESVDGEYDTREKVFVFQNDVKLYMDSIFLKTDRLDYLADSSKAFFGPNTNVWKDKGFIRSNAGWYAREDTTVYFNDRVYGHDEKYEFWSDELYWRKKESLVEMFDNISLLDPSRRVALVGDYLRHEQDSSNTYLLQNPAVIYYGSEDSEGRPDTLFLRADTLLFQGRYKCDFTDDEIQAARKRRADVDFDALTEYRNKVNSEREKKIEEGLRAAGKLPPLPKDSTPTGTPAKTGSSDAGDADGGGINAGKLPQPADSTGKADSLQVGLPAPKDSTPVRILKAFPNFRMYRKDMQAACDSMTFTDMDSIAVMVGRPIMWNTEKNQFTSEVMHLLVRDGDVEKGSMIEDARIVSKEAENCYDQIKSTEMMGFFNDNQLYRYDALGNVNAILYMEENGQLANINLKQSKSLTSVIKNGKAQRMLYLEEIKSDAYPIPDLEEDRRKMKGFEWRIEERPSCRDSITTRPLPKSWRSLFPGTKKPVYNFVDDYFDGYMTELYESIHRNEFIENFRSYSDSLAFAGILEVADSLFFADSLYNADSLRVEVDTVAGVKATETPSDAVKPAKSEDVKGDTAKVEKKLSARERREMRRAERKARREARRAGRRARREARMAKRRGESSPLPQSQPQD